MIVTGIVTVIDEIVTEIGATIGEIATETETIVIGTEEIATAIAKIGTVGIVTVTTAGIVTVIAEIPIEETTGTIAGIASMTVTVAGMVAKMAALRLQMEHLRLHLQMSLLRPHQMAVKAKNASGRNGMMALKIPTWQASPNGFAISLSNPSHHQSPRSDLDNGM